MLKNFELNLYHTHNYRNSFNKWILPQVNKSVWVQTKVVDILNLYLTTIDQNLNVTQLKFQTEFRLDQRTWTFKATLQNKSHSWILIMILHNSRLDSLIQFNSLKGHLQKYSTKSLKKTLKERKTGIFHYKWIKIVDRFVLRKITPLKMKISWSL